MKRCLKNPNINCTNRVFCEKYYCEKVADALPEPSPTLNNDCTHSDTSIVVIAIVVNCETTALQCDFCGQILTKPETDCR